MKSILKANGVTGARGIGIEEGQKNITFILSRSFFFLGVSIPSGFIASYFRHTPDLKCQNRPIGHIEPTSLRAQAQSRESLRRIPITLATNIAGYLLHRGQMPVATGILLDDYRERPDVVLGLPGGTSPRYFILRRNTHCS